MEKGVGETQMMAFQQSEDEEEDGPEQVTLQEVRAIAAVTPVYYQPGASLCTLVLVFHSASSAACGPEGFVSFEHHLFLLSGSRGSTKGEER